MRRYSFAKPSLDRRRSARLCFPWPLSHREECRMDEAERQQQDLAHRWRRGYEARRKGKAA